MTLPHRYISARIDSLHFSGAAGSGLLLVKRLSYKSRPQHYVMIKSEKAFFYSWKEWKNTMRNEKIPLNWGYMRSHSKLKIIQKKYMWDCIINCCKPRDCRINRALSKCHDWKQKHIVWKLGRMKKYHEKWVSTIKLDLYQITFNSNSKKYIWNCIIWSETYRLSARPFVCRVP